MGAQEDYESLQSLAERMGLDEKASGDFIGEGMSRLGHKLKQMWEDNDESGNSGSVSFFGTKPANGRPAPQRRAASGGGGQYRD